MLCCEVWKALHQEELVSLYQDGFGYDSDVLVEM